MWRKRIEVTVGDQIEFWQCFVRSGKTSEFVYLSCEWVITYLNVLPQLNLPAFLCWFLKVGFRWRISHVICSPMCSLTSLTCLIFYHQESVNIFLILFCCLFIVKYFYIIPIFDFAILFCFKFCLPRLCYGLH